MASLERVFAMGFAKVYPLYVQKAERKGRSRAEVDTVISWLTGYSDQDLARMVEQGASLQEFFDGAPAFNPASERITGLVCGVRVEEVEPPLMRRIRMLDKLVDELARGRALEKILRE